MSQARVLVVEDERIVALHLQQRLRSLGYDPSSPVASGEQALARVRSELPDIVLMDIHIEGPMDGIETASEIQKEFHTPIIYLTAYSEAATLERARGTKPYGYLVKPFSERELHATIQMALERSATDSAIRESEERLHLALEAAEMASWELDVTSRTLLHVGKAQRLFGYGHEVFSGPWERFLETVHEEDRDLVDRALERTLDGHGLGVIEFRSVHPDGSVHWLKVQGRIFTAESSARKRLIGVIQDVTARRSAEAQLRQAAMVFEATQEGILILDDRFVTLDCNPGYCAITGYDRNEVIGRPAPLLSPLCLSPADWQTMQNTLVADRQWHGEIQGRRRDGKELPVLANIAAVADRSGQVSHYILLFSDLTAIRLAQERFQHLAHFDPLTDLPNRLLAMDRLEHAMQAAERNQGKVGLLFVDLDHFKQINDTLGHSVGDDLLRAVAKALRLAVRAEDTVARLGGDEFMVIVDRVEHPEALGELADRIIATLSRPVTLLGMEFAITASVGISLFPEDGTRKEDLIRAADTAMYAAKDAGRSGFAFYRKEMTEQAALSMERDRDLRRGFEKDELRLHYQPQVELATGAIIGVEALIRWQHPIHGLCGANDVVPVAEKSRLIMELGDWVLREACWQARAWQEAGLPPLRMAVNVSARQMQPDRLPNVVRQILDSTGLDPALLEIEITESTLQDSERCVATLHALKALGVSLAIDDFGTGYSCLGSLKSLPIDRIKIDRSFVQDIPHDRNDEAIAEAIIAMAHKLNMVAIAEGIETEEQRAFLRARGCEEGQGYLYARPMTADAVAALLRDQQRGTDLRDAVSAGGATEDTPQ
ncbi:EAL domain-containing protein [Azospirillum griseum]|uniref:EAL domain-containing protein n=1 Tax=Azospirillum griseum TaxID=2496639 RepID=A0A3S0R6T4_9PROT|nr:EAL domain-containing protein [Azospirillum griseum]RTR17065.1 EAL domain-containing protein [Azospirillum griseum]